MTERDHGAQFPAGGATGTGAVAATASPHAPRTPPREHLDPKARTLWRISGLVGTLPVLVIAIMAAVVMRRFLDWDGWLVAVPFALTVLVGLASALVLPDLTWKHWRYEVGEDEVDLQHGVWTVTRTLVPMARIQHVDTRRGPLERRFGLASVVLHTAAGASEIPALADPVAEAVRDRIALLANTREEL
ncbi:MAG: PH domain-containing protein [Chloroflexota bacterium]|nr:PH domain-containing protein [Chloroflexota bacterium]